jgi:hypothetical protein
MSLIGDLVYGLVVRRQTLNNKIEKKNNVDVIGHDSGSRTDEESLLTSDDDDVDEDDDDDDDDDDDRREERTTDDDLLRTTDDDDGCGGGGGIVDPTRNSFTLSPTKRKVIENNDDTVKMMTIELRVFSGTSGQRATIVIYLNKSHLFSFLCLPSILSIGFLRN